MSALEIAADHARRRADLAESLREEAKVAWGRVDSHRISESWIAQLPRLLLLLTAGQLAAAQTADRYVDAALDAQDLDPTADALTSSRALAGIASDGRPLESLLAQPGITAKVALSEGHTLDYAMAAGGVLAQLIAHTQVTDAGRVADEVALAARRDASGFTRMVVGKTCSRCILLAGRWYRWNAGFKRHPKCDCVGIPSREAIAGDVTTDPRKIFDSMSAVEQDRVFTKAGAAAIREGADLSQVVNARRGMQTASVFGRDVLVTIEGTTTRGAAGARLGARRAETKREGDRYRRAVRVRLMPEQIFRDARDRDDAIRLLKLHGYIL